MDEYELRKRSAPWAEVAARGGTGFGPWAVRVKALVHASRAPIVVRNRSDAIADALAECLESMDRPVVRLSIPVQGIDDVEIGNQFADAVNVATRSQLLQYGLGLEGTLGVFAKFIDLLGPFTVLAHGADELPTPIVERILSLNRGGSIVVMLAVSESIVGRADCTVLDREVSLTLEEALWLTEGSMSPAAVEELLAETNGDYGEFLGASNRLVGNVQQVPILGESSPLEAALEFGLDAETIVTAVMKRRKYLEAFRLACEHLPDRVPKIIDECGEAYFARGMFERFWILLSRLPETLLENEDVLRWHYAAAMTMNRHAEVVPIVEDFLSRNEAPELRAQYAASMPRKELLAETTRAVNGKATPITLRHHAFALSISGRGGEAIETLQRALRRDARRARGAHSA